MKSKALTLVAVLSCAAVILIGCGGGGGGGSSTGSGGTTAATTGATTAGTTGGTVSPFGGRWDGTFTQASPADNGTITLAIAGNGAVSGDVFDANTSQEGILSGIMTNSGAMSFKVKFSSATETWSGNGSINGSNHLVGTVNVTRSGTTTSRTFDLTAF